MIKQKSIVMHEEDAVEVYRDLASHPTVHTARIVNIDSPGHVKVYSEWSQRDLDRMEKIKFARNHVVQLDVVFPLPPVDISSQKMLAESASGKYRAILRVVKDKKGDDKQFIEIWDQKQKVNNIDIENLEQHGKVYDDGQFGCFEWSHAETHLLYVAEKKRPKAKSFFDKKAVTESLSKSKDELSLGDEYVFYEDWGEQLVGKSRPVICVLDVESGIVSALDNLPENISPGQAVWCPDDQGVVCVGWDHDPFRLGLIYCPIRKNALYHIDLKTSNCVTLDTGGQAVRSPRFSPDMRKLVYLDNPVGGPHYQCSRLVMCDWPTRGVVPVVDVIKKPQEIDGFPGLFLLNMPHRCWSSDNKRVVLSTQWRSKVELVVVHVETGYVRRLTNDPNIGVWTALDVHNDLIIANCSSPNMPNHLVIGKLPELGEEANITWTNLDEPRILDEISWKVCEVKVPEDQINSKYPELDYEYYLMTPSASTGMKVPLIVCPHGGPHSVFSLDFMLYFAGWVKCGFAVLAINYRGSTGFGQNSVDSLPGNIGTQDVQDCQNAVNEAIKSAEVDPERVVVVGGSHGGFLTLHLIGQYPDFYKAACTRNPVVNAGSMVASTDIPDWCYCEGGFNYDSKTSTPQNPDVHAQLFNKSGMSFVDKVKTPVLIMIGEEDKRVPPKQGHELRRALQARGVPVRTLVYPKNAHPIITVDAESDAFINIEHWFKQHI